MILDKEIKIKIRKDTIDYYRSKGYSIEDGIKSFIIDPNHLPSHSRVLVNVRCDICYKEKEKPIKYCDYYKSYKKHKRYACCKACSIENTKLTNVEKWGYENVFQNEEIKKKLIESNNERWGVDYPQQNKEILEKSNKTNYERYGVDRPAKSDIVKKKIIETNNKRYNGNAPLSSPIIYKKMLNTLKLNYGESINNISQLEDVKKKKNDKNVVTILEKYSNIFDNKIYSIEEYSTDNMIINHKKCNRTFSINITNLINRIGYKVELCTLCNPISEKTSYVETQFKNFIFSLGVNIEANDKTVLGGQELDIWIPSLNIALEFNGLYWHSERYKNKNYHLNKTLECQNKNIDLLHIWEDDWNNKQDIYKSIIKNRLGKIDNIIYARKCIIKEVKSNIVRKFLNENHIQSFAKSKYKLGLYYQDELVSLMTFGYRKTNTKKEFELIRFCNKIDINVIGASSKLFKYFIKNYKIEEDYIISYADISLFDGNMYEKLGFKEVHLSKPNYFWVVDKQRQHRWKYNKQKLIKEGFSKDKTEVDIMHKRGFYRIWGCGQKRYEYHF